MASRDPARPNVLFVLSDDQGCWAMGCAGNREIRTPNLDRLAATGMRFENFFCTSPVCSPARASIVTGRMPSRHGVHDWLRAGNSSIEPDRGGELIEYLRGQPGYTDILAANGYVCGLSGKWHLGDAHHPQKGFTFWEVHAMGGGPYYQAPLIKDGAVYKESRYVTDVITDNALRFLAEQARPETPFYLGVHYTAPHSPWGRDQHPTDIYDDYHRGCPLLSVPDEPTHPWQNQTHPFVSDPEKRRAALSGYYAAVTAMDTNIGRILESLDQLGLRQNTMIIFMGDNGMNMGHHGIHGKGNGTFPLNMYDTSVKVPAIVSWPGRVPAGQVCAELLSQYDVMPTLLDCTGTASALPSGLPGRSFAGILRGERPGGADFVVVFDEYGPVRMIRTREWKYVHRYPYGPHELYDLVNDPGEARNLADDTGCRPRLKELKGEMEAWFLRHSDPALDGTHEPVTGAGQVGRAGPAGEGAQNFASAEAHLKTHGGNPYRMLCGT